LFVLGDREVAVVETETAGSFLAFHVLKGKEHREGLDVGGAKLLAIALTVLFRDGEYLHLAGNALLVLPQKVAFMQVVYFFEKRFLRMIQLPVVLVLDIVETQDDLAVIEAFVVEQIGAMDAFEQDGVVVPEQPFQQLAVRSGTDDIGEAMGKTFMSFMPGIIVHLNTIFIQYRLMSPAIFKAMQMDLYPGIKEGPKFMEQVEDSPVIHRVRHVQAHDM
jgi:hypothetical protein